jgi:hypothetical protein
MAACSALVGLASLTPRAAAAQYDYLEDDEDELPGGARVQGAEPDDPWRIVAFGGAGVGFRLISYRLLSQDTVAPVYAEVGGGVFFPGREIRHGATLGVSTNLTEDGQGVLEAAQQYVITPSYVIRFPLRYYVDGLEYDWLSVSGRIGVPLGVTLTNNQARSDPTDVGFSWGVSVAAGAVFKFLTGLGVYLDVSFDLFFGVDTPDGNVFPVVTPELGLLFSYEVL